MKKSIFLVLLLLTTFFSSAEIFVLKSGDVIKGNITNSDDKSFDLKTSYGEITLDREDIDKIYYSDEEYEKSTLKKDVKEEAYETLYTKDYEKNAKKRLKELTKKNLFYQQYKLNSGLAVAFGIPGLCLSLGTVVFGTPFLIVYYPNIPELNYYDFNYFSNPYLIGAGLYISFISVGVILDVISIVNIIFAVINYRRYEKSSKIALLLDYRENSTSIGMKVRF